MYVMTKELRLVEYLERNYITKPKRWLDVVRCTKKEYSLVRTSRKI